jgi:CPA1 family monovalent cation:H+ antiporter
VVLFTLLVNAPTIRPLIKALGIDRLDDDERAELKRAIGLVKHQAQRTLGRLSDSGLLSPQGGRQAGSVVDAALTVNSGSVTEAHQHLRYRKQTLRVELEALEELFKANIIPQYTFLDLRGDLRRKQDEVGGGETQRDTGEARPGNPFLMLEGTLLRWLREHDWAAGILSRLQGSRTTQHLLKDMARILMAEAALRYAREDSELPEDYRAELVAHYERRIALYRARVDETRRDFPEFFKAFEGGFALRAALARADLMLESERHHGSISAKPFNVLEKRLHQARAEVAPLSNPVAELETRSLLAKVPLLGQLPEESLEEIASRATTVSFLFGDTIIGEGDHGDALYVVARGRVAVSRLGDNREPQVIAELGTGDFFGETALLGDSIRTATVTALKPCSLVRLTRRDVLQIAERHPKVEAILEATRTARSDAPEAPAGG